MSHSEGKKMGKNIFRVLIFILVIVSFSKNSSINSAEINNYEEQSAPNQNKIKIGLFGIGLDTYWSQFDGLYERLNGYQESIANRMSTPYVDIEIINTGIVDNPIKARETGDFLEAKGVEAVFLYISTYALSSTVLPVVQQLKVPVIVLSLQPSKAIDYKKLNAMKDRGKMTGEWLAYCQACSAPEIASVFNRAHIDYHLITGSMDDDSIWEEIKSWIDAIRVSSVLRNTRVGTLGHYYGGMLDVYSDMTQLASIFGCHFEIMEMTTLNKYHKNISKDQVNVKLRQFYSDFDVDQNCTEQELVRAAKTSAALDALIHDNKIGCLAYYYEGSDDSEYEDIITSVIPGNTLLTMRNVPIAGEYEIKNVIAMKIMDIFGVGGSFSEFYALDLNDDVVILGHDGPGHARIAEGKVKLVPLPVYHGKPGKGLSIQMRVKQGPTTLLSVVQDGNGKIKFIVAEGESVAGPILEIGNTNSRYRFPISANQFLKAWSEQGPAHHMAIGIGHIADKIEKLAKILKIECTIIC
jgi:L-arabinose isomerase